MISELLVFFAFLLASFVHTTTGFGSALVGMPILVFAIGLQISAPLLALLSQIVNLGVLWQNWKDLDWRHSLVLIIPSIFGVPIGLLFLKGGHELLLNTILGIILIGYGIFSYFFNNTNKGSDNKLTVKPIRLHWGAIAGFIAGILGGAYNANGPPVIIYASYANQEKGAFRSILQAFFLVNGFVIIAGHAIAGLITKDVLRYSLFGLPGLILGMLMGFYIDRFLTPQRFRNIVVLGIILLGLALILPALYAILK